MTIALCLALGALAATLFMRIANGAEPCQVSEDELDQVDADMAQVHMISWPAKDASTGDDALLDPFEEPAPSSTVKVETREPDPVDTAAQVVKDVRSGNWRDAIAGLVILLMIALKKVGARSGIFKGDRGGTLLTLLVTSLAGFSLALASGAPLADFKLWFGILMGAGGATGLWHQLKNVIAPADADPWGPVWLRKILGMG